MTMCRLLAWIFVGSLMGAACLSAGSSEAQTGTLMEATDQRVAEKFAAFKKEEEVSLIYQALDLIETAVREAPAGPAERKREVSSWLRFFAALDQNIDPHWDPNRLPVKGAPLPPDHGIVFPSGEVDPSTIPDPVERAKYVEAMKTNKDYARRYNIQLQLRRIDERAMRSFGRLISEKYTGSEADRREFDQLLNASPANEGRKKHLRALMSNSG